MKEQLIKRLSVIGMVKLNHLLTELTLGGMRKFNVLSQPLCFVKQWDGDKVGTDLLQSF